MTPSDNSPSRRAFVKQIGRAASAAALVSAAPSSLAVAAALPHAATPDAESEWDLSWIAKLATATDRAVFDWPSLGSPADPIIVELADRYLKNCAAAYGTARYVAQIVVNIRTQAVPAALSDAMWKRFGLGVEYKLADPTTSQPAERNPFWYRAPDPAPGVTLPCLADLQREGASILVCDFALTNLSKRLAARMNQSAEEIHTTLRGNLVAGAFAVPSGIFGLARSQNAGCALVHV
ncbi:MAG: hypothetical protein ABJB66_04600 [Gemmatimonadaceae bacterium]